MIFATTQRPAAALTAMPRRRRISVNAIDSATLCTASASARKMPSRSSSTIATPMATPSAAEWSAYWSRTLYPSSGAAASIGSATAERRSEIDLQIHQSRVDLDPVRVGDAERGADDDGNGGAIQPAPEQQVAGAEHQPAGQSVGPADHGARRWPRQAERQRAERAEDGGDRGDEEDREDGLVRHGS